MKTTFVMILITLSVCINLLEQTANETLTKTITVKDSTFWAAYNNCDIAGMQQYLTDDVEFYHDKGGITIGKEKLITTIKNNLCSNPNFGLRREAVKHSVHVYPLMNNGAMYGAIISGEHVFYILEKGKPERLDGQAKFTHLWLLKDNIWKTSRILSYDHRPAGEKASAGK